MPKSVPKSNKILTFKFFHPGSNRWIDAPEEVWRWEAHYEDGQVLKQFDDQGVFHQFSEIDLSKLAMFKMVSPHYSQTYSLLMSDPNMKLIHFYRNTILNAGTTQETRSRLYCFGYEKKIGPKVHKVIFVITPTNNLLITENPELITTT